MGEETSIEVKGKSKGKLTVIKGVTAFAYYSHSLLNGKEIFRWKSMIHGQGIEKLLSIGEESDFGTTCNSVTQRDVGVCNYY